MYIPELSFLVRKLPADLCAETRPLQDRTNLRSSVDLSAYRGASVDH